jgi:hypothetical protein
MASGISPESTSRLVERAKNDQVFFHELIWNRPAALERADFLSDDERIILANSSPEDLVQQLAAGGEDPGGGCGATCGASCGASCGATCGASCGGSCGASCAATCALSGIRVVPDELSDESGAALTDQHLQERISGEVDQTFTRHRR